MQTIEKRTEVCLQRVVILCAIRYSSDKENEATRDWGRINERIHMAKNEKATAHDPAHTRLQKELIVIGVLTIFLATAMTALYIADRQYDVIDRAAEVFYSFLVRR